MILPIYIYGSRCLREPATPVEAVTPDLRELVENMIETMHGASGIGLAAPQVGRSEHVFVIDLSPLADDLIDEDGFLPSYARGPMVFINPEVVDETDDDLEQVEEGCLSIPDVREHVTRPERVRIRYRDIDFEPQELVAEGLLARVIQHEYDHLEGVLFIDRISGLRRRMLQRRLRAIARGEVEVDYPVMRDG